MLLFLLLLSAISGRVVEDRSGNALPSAEIRVMRGSEVMAELETNSDGRFELPDLPAGDYRLEVSKPNYQAATLKLPADPLIVRLVRFGVISGHVLDADGKAVSSATVFAMRRQGDSGPWRPFAPYERGHQALVDENGEYRLFNLPPGQYAAEVTYGASKRVVSQTGQAQAGALGSGVSYYPSNSEPRIFSVSGGEDYSDIDFSIAPGALYQVSGKLDLETPKRGFWLALTSQAQPAFATAMTAANDDGSFHFSGIPPGSYWLSAAGPAQGRGAFGMEVDENSLFGRMPLEVGGDVEGVTVGLQKGRSASLMLAYSVQGCPAALEFSFSSLEDSGADLESNISIGFDKPVKTRPLPPGRYLLTPKTSDLKCPAPSPFILDWSKPVNETIKIPVEHHANP